MDDLHGGYGSPRRGVQALRGLSLKLEPGTSTAVVGPNGAGKTTLIRTLLGFLRPWSGHIRVGQRCPTAYRRSGLVSYVAEEVALPPGWTVGELLQEGARLRGYRGARRRARTRRCLQDQGLGGLADTPVQLLSRGATRRAAMAFALVKRSPGLVLLDEPLGGLDAESRARTRALLTRLREAGATILVTTHELREVDGLATSAAILTRGRIAARLSGHRLAHLEDAVRDSGWAP